MKLLKSYIVIFVVGLLILFTKWLEILKSNYVFFFNSQLIQEHVKLANVKYVLLWNKPRKEPFSHMVEGHEMFVKRNCTFKNCYITSDFYYFNNVTTYDVILFNAPEVVFKNSFHLLPQHRSQNQSYIFVSTESADYYYVPDSRYNNVFNFTWTYKLDSEIYFGYLLIKDHNGKVIGPDENMSWISIEDMAPINETIKEKLKHKKYAAAWFVSNCDSLNNRQKKALLIRDELNKYGMTLDIFGRCWYEYCPKKLMKKCLEMLQRDYYFYFAFENSMSDDYVTEKLLNSLQNYVVPVVFGGAEYKRFMPDGIYLDARNMSVTELVKQMVEIMNNETRYHNFFKWHNHYSYHSPDESAESDRYCQFCEFINRVNVGGKAIEDFFHWWNAHAKILA